MVLLVLLLAAAAAAGATVRLYSLGLFAPHTGRHTATYLTAHTVTARPPHTLNIGKWI